MDPTRRKTVPSQQDANLNDPQEHFVWALRSIPMIAGSGMMVHPSFLRRWSEHLWQCGFAHRDYLEGLADEDGNIHVDRLPKQTIRFQEAFRGPHHHYNNAARWVGENEPEPKPFVVPNIEQMTTQEKYALAYQLDQQGIKLPDQPKPSVAETFEEGSPT